MAFDFEVIEAMPGPFNLIASGISGKPFKFVGDARTTTINLRPVSATFHDGRLMSYVDFPELVELHEWFEETFGPAGYEWTHNYNIRVPQSWDVSLGVNRFFLRDVFAQFHFKEMKQMALFKLRWG